MSRLAWPLLALSLLPVQKRKVKPVKCVRFATTWEGAIAEAKLLRMPIVVHSHKIHSPECKLMRERLLQHTSYRRFAKESTVEVIVVAGFEEAITDKAPAVARYKRRIDGKTVEYLARWPNLTITDVRLMNDSGAIEYNFSEVHPYTTVVDPFTRGEMKSWKGAFEAKALMEVVRKATAEIRRQHRAPKITRKELYALEVAEARAERALAQKTLGSAWAVMARFDKKLATWPESATSRLGKIRDAIKKLADGELAAVTALAATDKAAAKKRAVRAGKVVKGTPFAKQLQELRTKLGL